MSRDVSDLYRSLAEDADRGQLALPEVLRRRADRRARLRAAGGALAVAVLVGGVVTGARLTLTANPAPAPPPATTPTPTPTVPMPSPTPSATPSTPPATSTTQGAGPGGPSTSAAPRTPTSIPDRAFFTLAKANRTGSETAIGDKAMLPELCDARYSSAAAIVQSRSRNVAYRLAGTPEGYVPDGSYAQTITIYRSGRADDFLRELRQAVRDCPEQDAQSNNTPSTSRQRLLPDSGYGDESVLFEMRSATREGYGDPAGGDEVRLVRAIRVGDVVTVLWEQGWENTSSERSQVDADSRRAVAAIEDWLG
ncbi:hypothetical protein GA0070609_0243 [Micromonospora echinaurantiaca]|uniref:PknH-like extracellular domain-containing protein n=1 Tax=Micromonospora echinaurantiaca TaxID=47857 RepID=A0A1C5GRF9_9ACTN|nr:hypothetical protein [Micromonospora echinaurantiaca]SCG36354.1 hypothetical protein GA0070609_0243 [Micromonospora echinaurantiaca]